MNRVCIFSLILLLAMAGFCVLNAQSPQYSIFDALERQSNSKEGVVVIHQSDAVKRLVGTRIDSENIDVVNGKTYITTKGYRIQVYSGNIQVASGNNLTSRAETENLKTKIKEHFPDTEPYIIYEAPFWKLHVGDYLTYEEASIMLRELRKTFPQRRNEINIFESNINLLLD